MKKLCFISFALLLPITSFSQKVNIDVGHFNEKPGAISAYGETELSYNQLMAKNLEEAMLYANMSPSLSGIDGTLSSFKERVSAGKGKDFFLSIHHDSVQEYDLMDWEYQGQKMRYTDKANGFSVFVNTGGPEYKQSLDCANSIAHSLLKAGFEPNYYHHFNNPKRNFKLLSNEFPVYSFDRLAVLRNNPTPAILLEAGVIVNPREAYAFKDNMHRTKFAVATTIGLRNCLNDRY